VGKKTKTEMRDLQDGDLLESSTFSDESCHACVGEQTGDWHHGGYHGFALHEKCYDKCIRSRHRKMRQASSDGSHKGAIKADIEEMTTDVDTWRVKVCAKALSDNKQLQEKARDEAFQFAKNFHKHQDITRDVFRKVYPLYNKRG